jgi:hypothetical protein
MNDEAPKMPPRSGKSAWQGSGENDFVNRFIDAMGGEDLYRANVAPSSASSESLTQTVIQSARESFPPPGQNAGPADEATNPDAEPAAPSPKRMMRVGQGPTRVESVAEKDALSRQAITDALVGLLRNRLTTEPLTIGLFGEWGSGKSSQVSFAKQRLGTPVPGHPHIRVIEFNAWEHEKCDNLSAALAQTVVEQLIQDTSLTEQWKLARQLAARQRAHISKAAGKDWISVRGAIYQWIVPFISLGPALALMLALLVFQADWNWLAKLVAATGVIALGGWKAVNKYVTDNLTTWFKRIASGAGGGPFGLPDYAAKLGTFHEIRQTLQHLVALRVKPEQKANEGEYLLVVVDDLDRCGVGTIKLVLDAVRLVTNLPRVVTMVAVDDRIAFPAVASFFEQFKKSGRETSAVARDYLAKVFNVSITLPPVSEKLATEFIEQHLFAGEYRKATPAAEPAGSKDAQPPSPEPEGAVPPEASLRISEEEVTEFTKLARRIGMTNPRALWRMKQAWYLLRAMAQTVDSDFSFEPWMRSLFVREAVLAQPPKVRRLIENWESSLRRGQMTTVFPGTIPVALTELLKESGTDVVKCWDHSDIVLLPAGPSSLDEDE